MNDTHTKTSPSGPVTATLALVAMVAVAVPLVFVGRSALLGPPSPRELIRDQQHDYLETLEIPEFTLTSQDGEPVPTSVLDGRYTVLDFVFTNCTLACPVMFSNLGPLHRELAGTPVRFLSISVDPVHDTPETLRAFADRMDIDTSRWTLAACDRETLDALIVGLQFTVSEDESEQLDTADGGKMSNIIHPTRALLVGPDREVLGLYSAMEYEGVEALRRDLELLLNAR